jgi:hypothetical protein
MTADKPKDLRAIIVDSDLVDRALRRAAARALSRHKRLGNSIAVWQDGQVVWIPPEEIVVPEDSELNQQ